MLSITSSTGLNSMNQACTVLFHWSNNVYDTTEGIYAKLREPLKEANGETFQIKLKYSSAN